MSDCVFCRIAGGAIRADVIYQDDLVVAFVDTHPIRPGHALIIPREHVPFFEDLPAASASRITEIGQRLARALKSLHGVPRAAFLFSGGDIAHAHAHVVPLQEKTDITSRRYIAEEQLTFRSPPRASAAELAATAARLRTALAG